MITTLDKILMEEIDKDELSLLCADYHNDCILEHIMSTDPREEIDMLFPIGEDMKGVIYDD